MTDGQRYELMAGDCLERMAEVADGSVDAIVTDPPYGLSFMGKRWDYDVPEVAVWSECLRVLKPGGHMMAFAGTRTQHRMCCRIEDGGFEIRDMLAWVYGSGFPKSLDVSKAIDKAAGAEREVVGQKDNKGRVKADGWGMSDDTFDTITAPATDAARQWNGWGTALKPAFEPITLARKPLVGTVAANVLAHGTGALNIDGCRVGTEAVSTHSRGANGAFPKRPGETSAEESGRKKDQRDGLDHSEHTGRFPANFIHDGSDEVLALFPISKSGVGGQPQSASREMDGWGMSGDGLKVGHGDSGSAARFFYCAKAAKSDRGDNGHPTVKPTDLMRYLCRLVTPPNGIVLDPFMGSGSTGKACGLERFRFLGIERDPEYFAIAERRVREAYDEAASVLAI